MQRSRDRDRGGAQPPRRAASTPARPAARPGAAPRARQSAGPARRPASARRGARRRGPGPGSRIAAFLRRWRWLLPPVLGGVVVAVILASVLAPEPEPAAPEATQAATEAPVYTAAPESDLEPPNDPIYPTNYHVLEGKLQTDRPLGLIEGEQVPDSYFDGAVFVGDSISLKLRQFVMQRRQDYPTLLGNAQFLTAGSFAVYEALGEITETSIHPVIDGVKMTLEDALAAMDAKKVYIMLGMNDVSHVGIENSIYNMGLLLRRIREKLPDVPIFVQSATPRLHGEKPKTETLFSYDIGLYDQLAQQRPEGIYFVDVAYIMRDENGILPADYCSDPEDMAMHFTDAACMEWIKYLYTHTPGAA